MSRPGEFWAVCRRTAGCTTGHDHDWIDRGTPGDRWQECWLCGEQRDVTETNPLAEETP